MQVGSHRANVLPRGVHVGTVLPHDPRVHRARGEGMARVWTQDVRPQPVFGRVRQCCHSIRPRHARGVSLLSLMLLVLLFARSLSCVGPWDEVVDFLNVNISKTHTSRNEKHGIYVYLFLSTSLVHI